jgi:fermentation-respiration switch protein FrsA (DUF1100 family)
MAISREVILRVEGIDITGRFYLPGKGDRTPYSTVCICHGIPAGNPPDPNDAGYPGLAGRVCEEGKAAFIFNFRGAGTSGGNIDMPGWTRDLRAVIDYLSGLPEVDKNRLILFGFSAGAAVSVYLASQDKRPAAVIACACPADFDFDDPALVIERFRSIGIIRDDGFPASTGEWMQGFKAVSPVKAVGGIAPRPLLMVHGNEDDVVDIGQAYRLAEAAGDNGRLIVVDGATHRLRHSERAMAIVFDWLRSLS